MSNNWLYGFLERWQETLSSLKPSKLESNRAKCATPEVVENYYKELKSVLDKYDLHTRPDLIYNLDETGLQPDHRPPNIIGPVTTKPQAITSPRSTTVTLIGCTNALGNSLPPYFVFKGKRYSEELLEGSTPGTKAAMSDSGWSNREIFQKYLTEHFLPLANPAPDRKVLLLYDGHASHISPTLINWARENNIILFVLPPHTSHLLQPLDVGVFGPFKHYYHSECSMFLHKNIGRVITRYDIAALACKAYLKATTPQTVQNAFKKTGVYPLKQDAIPEEALYTAEVFREKNPVEKVKVLKGGREEVQKFIDNKVETLLKIDQKTDDKKEEGVKRPAPGGKAITEGDFCERLELYVNEQQKTKSKTSAKRKLSYGRGSTDSQQPSTSGVNTNSKKRKQQEKKKVASRTSNGPNNSDSENEDDVVTNESDNCCVCKRFSPPNLADLPYLKIVSWAQCDKCGHWVHLSFCTSVRVVRKNTEFHCIHCA